MAIDRRSAGAALKSNLPPTEFLAGRESGFERWWGPEIAFDAQSVALQLRPSQRLEAAEVPVLRRGSRVLQESVVGQGVDGAAGQDLQHLRLQLGPGEGPAKGYVHAPHVGDQAR